MKYLFACKLCGVVFTVEWMKVYDQILASGGEGLPRVYHDCEDEWVGYKGVAQMVGCKDGD